MLCESQTVKQKASLVVLSTHTRLDGVPARRTIFYASRGRKLSVM